ncbi:MAG TPA: site-specific integrase [Rickettsiales bacterium]|nr:site-specific integrase [Rickettsiales bacterium]
MSLTKRGNTWWISFTTPSGQRIRCSARTEDKKAAQEYHDKLKAESWRTEQLGEKPKRSWDEAALKWLQETSHKKTHQMDVDTIRWLQQFFRGKLLTDLTRDVIAEVGAKKKENNSAATANRVLALIRSILRRAAFEWEWIDKAPRIRLYPEPKRRVRWLTPEQVLTLLTKLPEHLVDIVRFSLATGLRQSNVLELEWSQIDIPRKVAWIYADQAKGGRDIHVSLNATAIDVLLNQLGKHPKRVFTYKGNPIGQVTTKAWYNALKEAGIEDFRWHDLRHTWASWLAQGGVSLNVIQEMGAWESVEMVRRYAHLAPEKFGKHAMIVDNMLQDTIPAQSANQLCHLIEVNP